MNYFNNLTSGRDICQQPRSRFASGAGGIWLASVRLAAQEGRDIELIILLRIMHRCRTAMGVEALRGCPAGIERLRGDRGAISKRSWLDTQSALANPKHGLLLKLGRTDISEITTQEYHKFFQWVGLQSPSLAPATLNRIAVAFSKVMKLAQTEGLINNLPSTPRFQRKDNPRSFFRFSPLVEKDEDEYKLLLETAKDMAADHVRVRETTVT